MSLFLAIVLFSGFSAGIIHGLTNLTLVEPYLDEAIGIENQNLFASGEAQDSPSFWVEYNSYRNWQKGGQILAGGILGMSFGSLFGIIFAFSRKCKNNSKQGTKRHSQYSSSQNLSPFLPVSIRIILYPKCMVILGFS